ncbi:MAG: DUF805 domain-containing protein [Chloroflexota bacterium]
MKFAEAVQFVFSNYATFTGRAGRSEFWYWILFTFLVSIVISILASMITPSLSYVGNLFSLATLIPTIAVAARRMHDIGKSGWWQIVPLYNIYLAVQPSEGANAYGTGPAAAPVAA